MARVPSAAAAARPVPGVSALVTCRSAIVLPVRSPLSIMAALTRREAASGAAARTSHSDSIGKNTSSVTRTASEMRNGTTPRKVSAIGTSRARLLMM